MTQKSTLTDQILFLPLADKETQHDQNSGIGLFFGLIPSGRLFTYLTILVCVCWYIFPL